MTKLEKLIEELCPNGVGSLRIDDICDISRGRVMSKDYIKENAGDYPVYSSQTENNGELGRISSYDLDGEYLTWTTDGANAGSVFYRNGKFSITNVCGLLKAKDCKVISTRFLYHSLSVEAPKYVNKGMGNPKLMSNVMSRIKVSVPPLEIQSEIVHILDNFTELTAELNEKLDAELTARKKQYEYYRDELLTFDDDVEIVKLEEVAEYSKDRVECKSLTKDTYIGVENLLQNKLGKKQAEKVPSEGKSLGYKKGDILIGNIRPYLKKIWLADCDGSTNGDVLVIRNTHTDLLNDKYLYYVLSSDAFLAIIIVVLRVQKMPRGDKKLIMQYTFYLPSKEKQIFICSILDRFDTLCNDISQGLPAEIEARQKQYEYYRDKLLSFKESNY